MILVPFQIHINNSSSLMIPLKIILVLLILKLKCTERTLKFETYLTYNVSSQFQIDFISRSDGKDHFTIY